jgi:tRNA-2-methylthio-N6-dimethylallyladenosine synthase
MGPQYANRIGDLLEEVISGNQVVATEATRIRFGRAEPENLTGFLEWFLASICGRVRFWNS